MLRREGVALTVAVAVVATASGCGDAGGSDAVPTAKATVVLTDEAYHPARVAIDAGDRVTFVNRSESLNTAETPGGDALSRKLGVRELSRGQMWRHDRFDTRLLNAGEAESIRFDKPGVYPFESSLSDMHGTVTVSRPPIGDRAP